jgi:hypothetical protein
MFEPEEKQFKLDPHSFLLEPVYDSFGEGSKLVGFAIGLTVWKNLLNQLLPPGMNGIFCVVKDRCGDIMTFRVDGPKATFLGYEDLHDPTYDQYETYVALEASLGGVHTSVDGVCSHDMFFYPSAEYVAIYKTNLPAIYTSVVVLAFFVTTILLLVFDKMVTARQNKTMTSALRTNALVASLFPEQVRNRLMEEDAEQDDKRHGAFKKSAKSFMSDGDIADEDQFGRMKSRPIADFFPNTTIMFADIKGFTAWSSTREPFQVFMLLETM